MPVPYMALSKVKTFKGIIMFDVSFDLDALSILPGDNHHYYNMAEDIRRRRSQHITREIAFCY